MLLTHSTICRHYTFRTQVADDGTIHVGAAICHEVNGQTGEIINHFDPSVGREIADIRLAENPIVLSEATVYDELSSAVAAGHKVTLRTIIGKAVLREVKAHGIEADDVFTEVINRRLNYESEVIRLEEAAAWAEKIQADDDEAWVNEMIRNGYGILDYIDYSDRYCDRV
jgi:hypothetical protein